MPAHPLAGYDTRMNLPVRRRLLIGLVLLIGIGLGGALLWQHPPATEAPTVTTAASSPAAPAAAVTPVEIRIPAIALAAPLIQLGVQTSGELEVPQDYNQVGWYKYGSIPGQPGPAVFAGHLDSPTAPAIFYRLRELQPGHAVEVTLSDGSTVRFKVTKSASFSQDQFPTDAVYGQTPQPEIRLITCDGLFNDRDHRYSNNLVVFGSAE
jgi:sortase (surface protein transpeptidase)